MAEQKRGRATGSGTQALILGQGPLGTPDSGEARVSHGLRLLGLRVLSPPQAEGKGRGCQAASPTSFLDHHSRAVGRQRRNTVDSWYLKGDSAVCSRSWGNIRPQPLRVLGTG